MAVLCVKLSIMRPFILFLCLLFTPPASLSAPHFIVVGGADKPVGVYMKPFTYQGSGVSPAVVIENILLARLAQSGLFYQPGRLQPQAQWNLYHWRLAGVRYLISADINETELAIDVRLTVTDTLGTTPTFVWVELNKDAWQQATRVFARQLLYSLFYATYTDAIDSQYLDNTEPAETRYWLALVATLKQHWRNHETRGECRVSVSQLPGGQIHKYTIEPDCDIRLSDEVEQLFASIKTLPYGGLNAPFVRYFTVTFIAQG